MNRPDERRIEATTPSELTHVEAEAHARQLKDPFRSRMLERFPLLYAELATRPTKRSLPITLRGFEVGPGWQGLVERFSAKIEEVVGRQPAAEGPRYRIAQVKERFGRLLVGMAEATLPEIQAAIDAAEGESVATCEECGSRGRPRRHRSYVQVLCELHEGA
jgi:hypothetical protein